MTICHSLNSNFTWHLHCPKCKSKYNNVKQVEDFTKTLQENGLISRSQFSNNIDENGRIFKKEIICSKCGLKIIYTFDFTKEINK